MLLLCNRLCSQFITYRPVQFCPASCENAKLKKIFAELSLENEALRPAEKRTLVDYVRETFHMSSRASCRALNLSRSVYFYKPDSQRDLPVIEAIGRFAEKYPRYGFPKIFQKIRKAGNNWNHKRIHRIYCKLGLNLKRKGKQRLPSRNPMSLSIPGQMNQSWSVDFMSDSLADGRTFRTFNILDDFNRQALGIEVDTNLPAARIIRVLDQIASWRGYPKQIRMDNGPEFISLAMAEWTESHRIHLEFIKPGKPTQNYFVERFNRTYWEEILDYYIFKDLKEVRELTEA